MNIRKTTRILLFNELNHLLLFNMMDQTSISKENPTGRSIWFTVGGGVEEGETYEDAAKRELWEETGVTKVDWGPVVWIRELELLWNGELIRLIEHYYIARMKGTQIDLNHFTEEEKQGYIAHHWWSLEELKDTNEVIYPVKLAELLIPILKGDFPQTPIVIE